MGILDSLVGKNMKSSPQVLGLYIGIDEMYITQTSRKDGGVVLESLLRVPISNVDRSALKPLDLNEGFFGMDGWLESLGKVAAKKKWKTNKVVVSLSPAFCLLRHFVIPTLIERKHWKEAIPLQARKYIHFPFEKATYSYHVYEFETAATKQKRLGVIFALTNKSIVDRIQKGLKSVGLDAISIEPSSLSLSRAFNDSDKESVGDGGRIYSFFGKDMASFVFLNDGIPVLLREVEISGSLPMERRRFEITNSTEFIAKQLEKDPFEEAVLTGYEPDQWITALEADSKKPVRKWNLSEIYGIETKSAGEVAAIGATIKFYDRKSPDLDFIKGSRLSDYEYNASLTAWKIAVVLAGFFLILLGMGWLKVQTADAKMRKETKNSANLIADFAGLSANQIQSNLSKVQEQNRNLEGLTTNQLITPFLIDVVDTIPQQMWLNRLEYQNAFPPARREDKRIIQLEGEIQTGNADQDLEVGRKFRESILTKPSFRNLCGQMVGGMEYDFVQGKGRQAPITKFKFVCSKEVK